MRYLNLNSDAWGRWLEGRQPLYLLLALSLLLKAAMAACNDVINVDGALYISVAQKMAAGDFSGAMAAYRMPFFPLLIVVFHWLIPDWVVSGQAISVLALGTAVAPLWLVTRGLFGSVAAFWAGLAYAVAPWFNEFAADVVRDPVFLCCALWAVYFAWRAVTEGRTGHYLATSAWMLVALLARIEATVLPLAFILTLCFLAFSGRGRWRTILKGMLAFIALPAVLVGAGLIVFGPEMLQYVRFNSIVGRFTGVLHLDFLESYRRIYEQLQDLEGTLPGWSLGQSFSEIARHNLWLIYLIGLFQTTLKVAFPTQAVPMLVGFVARRDWNRGHLLLIAFLGTSLTACYLYHVQRNFIDTRYLALPALLLFPWIGTGTVYLLRSVQRFRWPRAILVLTVIALMLLPLARTVKGYVGQDRVVKTAGIWLGRQQGLEDFQIVCNDGRVPFYAGWGRDFFSADIERMETVASKRDVDLIIIETSKKRRAAAPSFGDYELWREFEGRKNVVLVFRKKR